MLTLATANTIAASATSASSVTMSIFGLELSSAGLESYKVLYQGQISNTVGVLYTVPSSTTAMVKTINLANTTGAAITVVLYVNGTTGPFQLASLPIPANGEAVWSGDGWKVIDAFGNTLVASTFAVQTTRQIIAGAGLTGGGDLSADRTIDVVAGDTTIVVNANELHANVGTGAGSVAAGNDSRITGAAVGTRNLTAGAGLTGGGDLTADRTFDVVAGDTTIVVNPNELHANVGTGAGSVAAGNDTRIVGAVQTTRNLTAGAGLTGGGDLSADRTFDVIAGDTTIVVNANELHANVGTGAGSVAAGNDSRITSAVQPARAINTTAPLTGGGDLSADRSLAISAATTSASGAQSAVDKARSDHWFNSAFYNVLDNGIATGNTAAVNDAAWAALMTAIVDNGTVYFPPSPTAYQFNSTATLSIPAGKHLRILGGGNQKSIIQTTHATVDIFTCGDWFQTFQGLKFISSVTRTAGAAINSGNNVSINVFDCDFAGMFNGINYTGGANAGNLAFVDNCGFTGTLNSGIIVNGQNANAIMGRLAMDGTSGVQQSGIEVNQCGSLLIYNSDLIRAQNNLNLNPGSGSNGIFSVYCSQVFMDTAATNGCLIQGSGTTNVQRVKFANCWFSSAGTHGLSINSTATNPPTGITLVNCDIFSNGNTGVRLLSGKDIIVTNCNIAGNVTAGIQLSAAAGAVTKLNAQSNSIGPTGGIGANGTGIIINAGAYGGITITGNDVSANTTANISDLGGTVPTSDMKKIKDNLGHLLGGALSTLGANLTPAIAETVVLSARIPANAVAVGQVFRVRAQGTCTTAGTSTPRVKVGANGTTADTSTWTISAAPTMVINTVVQGEWLLTVKVIGASGAIQTEGIYFNSVTPLTRTAAVPATQAINTTAAWFIDFTHQLSAGAVVWENVVIEAL